MLGCIYCQILSRSAFFADWSLLVIACFFGCAWLKLEIGKQIPENSKTSYLHKSCRSWMQLLRRKQLVLLQWCKRYVLVSWSLALPTKRCCDCLTTLDVDSFWCWMFDYGVYRGTMSLHLARFMLSACSCPWSRRGTDFWLDVLSWNQKSQPNWLGEKSGSWNVLNHLNLPGGVSYVWHRKSLLSKPHKLLSVFLFNCFRQIWTLLSRRPLKGLEIIGQTTFTGCILICKNMNI